MKYPLIGREEEKAILLKALHSPEAEMVAVIGRHRVGKTFLVNAVYQDQIDFEITGIQHAPLKRQLKNFAYQLSVFKSQKVATPSTWFDAFVLLINYLKTKDKQEKKIVFLDELPWLASRKSGFLQGLSFFWNSWAVKQSIVLVVCGSAASWMIRKVIHHKGGLHNRITKRIYLSPFNLSETATFLKSRNVYLDNYQIIQLYMAMGGIPYYLKEIESGKSAAQNINAICFAKNGLLRDEFDKLYMALFENAEKHLEIIRALAQKRHGLTRNELIQMTSLSDGGSIKRILEELMHSDFINVYQPFGKKKKAKLYRLTDEYSLFYLYFIEKNTNQSSNVWQLLSQVQAYKIWSGYAFESICLKHINQIKKALGISGVYAEAAAFYKKGTSHQQGTQIDLLIDRNDHVINLFEIKFYNTLFTLDKTYAQKLRMKMAIFRQATNTTKQLFMSMITTFGVLQNEHTTGLVNQVLTLEDLFEGRTK